MAVIADADSTLHDCSANLTPPQPKGTPMRSLLLAALGTAFVLGASPAARAELVIVNSTDKSLRITVTMAVADGTKRQTESVCLVNYNRYRFAHEYDATLHAVYARIEVQQMEQQNCSGRALYPFRRDGLLINVVRNPVMDFRLVNGSLTATYQ